MLYLYDGFHVERTLPRGDRQARVHHAGRRLEIVTRKAENPTWYNPALDSWGADLPAVVPGGPDNPMGAARALHHERPG